MAITLDGWKGLSMGMFTAVSILGAWVAVVMKRAKQLYVTSVFSSPPASSLRADSSTYVMIGEFWNAYLFTYN